MIEYRYATTLVSFDVISNRSYTGWIANVRTSLMSTIPVDVLEDDTFPSTAKLSFNSFWKESIISGENSENTTSTQKKTIEKSRSR